MFVWFSEIFADNSDIARLISILISAVVAISVVLLNQSLQRRREIREFRIGKYEELYNLASEFSVSYTNFTTHIDQKRGDLTSDNSSALGEASKATEIFTNTFSLYAKAVVILELYFRHEFDMIKRRIVINSGVTPENLGINSLDHKIEKIVEDIMGVTFEHIHYRRELLTDGDAMTARYAVVLHFCNDIRELCRQGVQFENSPSHKFLNLAFTRSSGTDAAI